MSVFVVLLKERKSSTVARVVQLSIIRLRKRIGRGTADGAQLLYIDRAGMTRLS